MRFSLSNCIALGTNDMNKAADYYEKVLGYERGKSSDSWIELSSGALKVYVCHDDVTQPVFDLQVDDIDAAENYLSENGFTKAVLSDDDKELFMKDPFGYSYCISNSS